MTRIRNKQDGRVHISELKEFSLSAAHYREACLKSRVASRPMVVGAAVDRMVFGGKVVLYPGKARAGGEWREFQLENDGAVICIESEYAEAAATARCVQMDPVAGPLVRDKANEFQRVMQWEAHGLECAAGIAGAGGRGGFDILNQRESCILDLKASADAEPGRLMRHAARMFWHCQGRWYLDGAQALSLDATRFKLIVAEVGGLACTVLDVTPRKLEGAAKLIRHWTENLRACDASGEFPGYCQSEVAWDDDDDIE
jgi:hypothetical protein